MRRPDATLVVADHNVPTTDRDKPIADDDSRIQVETLEKNAADFGLPYIPLTDARQGIVHIIGPEQGFTPARHDHRLRRFTHRDPWRLRALAFGIGTSEVEHVLATQTMIQKPRN